MKKYSAALFGILIFVSAIVFLVAMILGLLNIFIV